MKTGSYILSSLKGLVSKTQYSHPNIFKNQHKGMPATSFPRKEQFYVKALNITNTLRQDCQMLIVQPEWSNDYNT